MTFKIKFTQQQVDFLNQHFPEMRGTYDTPADELRWRAAQRSVLHFAERYVDKGGIPNGILE